MESCREPKSATQSPPTVNKDRRPESSAVLEGSCGSRFQASVRVVIAGSRTVVVSKCSLSPGFAGSPNPMFAGDGTMQSFSDRKDAVLDIVAALSQADI
ncbi:MAG TPA: hypothetical protein DCR10_01125 [Acidimicrobiaceae bacterium]|nr:hypothetical protein [Acidimicrobiaceae bacterium]